MKKFLVLSSEERDILMKKNVKIVKCYNIHTEDDFLCLLSDAKDIIEVNKEKIVVGKIFEELYFDSKPV